MKALTKCLIKKTKHVNISSEPPRCNNLIVKNRPIEQAMEVKYLDVARSAMLLYETMDQITKANRIAGYLNHMDKLIFKEVM